MRVIALLLLSAATAGAPTVAITYNPPDTIRWKADRGVYRLMLTSNRVNWFVGSTTHVFGRSDIVLKIPPGLLYKVVTP